MPLERAVIHSIPKPYCCDPVLPFVTQRLVWLIWNFIGMWLRLRVNMASTFLSDLAYSEIYFGETPPPSVLQVEGAMDVAVEFHVFVQDVFHAGLAYGLCSW